MITHSAKHRYASALYGVMALFMAACASNPQRDVTIHQSARDGVYLERIPTRQFQATHPIQLPSELIAKSLQGVQIVDSKGLLQSLGAQPTRTLFVFSQDDIALLAPAIADGLSQAAPDQQVAFRIVQREDFEGRDRTGAGIGSGTAPQRNQESTTSGKLFVYGRSLYLTMHQFRHHTESPDTINMPNRRLPEPTGLRNRTVQFMPESALRPDIYAPPFAAEDGLTTLVIDYDILAKAPAAPIPSTAASPAPAPPVAPAAIPAATPPLQDDVQQIKSQMKQKEREVEELRKELEEIKRQLGNHSTKGGQTPSRKP